MICPDRFSLRFVYKSESGVSLTISNFSPDDFLGVVRVTNFYLGDVEEAESVGLEVGDYRDSFLKFVEDYEVL